MPPKARQGGRRAAARAKAQAALAARRRKNAKRGCELHSSNLRGRKESKEQNSWDTLKVWWAPVLTRGKLHVEIMDPDFQGETQEGARSLVAKVRAAVNVQFQGGAQQLDTLWTDHVKGFYSPNNGVMTMGYKAAPREHHFKKALGENASVQLNLGICKNSCYMRLLSHGFEYAWLGQSRRRRGRSHQKTT